MGPDLEFLRDYLEDEFGSVDGARVQFVLPTGTARSVDLDQDYDSESGNLHVRRGVRVRLRHRDYFFPAEWVNDRRMDLVRDQVAEIRAYLGD